MEKEQIIDYVTNTPGNSNAAVLRGMLEQIGSSDLPSNADANEGDVLTVGENHVNEWKTLNTAPIYIEANYDEDLYNVILTLDSEPITNSEIFALLDAGKDVKIILNSFDIGVHNELPVILNYVKTFNETVVEEDEEEQEIELDVETRYFQTCIMPSFSLDNSRNSVTYFNAYNLGISIMTHENVIVHDDVVNVVPYTFKGIEISLLSPVSYPIQTHRVDLNVLNAPQMHEFYENFILSESPWLNTINATLSYYADATPSEPAAFIKANLYGITQPEFDEQSNTFKSQLLFTDIKPITTSPYYSVEFWRVIWEYDVTTNTDTFYIPAQSS